MNIWTFLTTGAVAGVAGWGGKWLQSRLDAANNRRIAIEDQIRQHVATFGPKYDLMSNHAYLLAIALVGYLERKMDVQLTADTASASSYLNALAVDAARDSLFSAAKFYRTVSDLFWVQGAKYYLPDAWAQQTMKDLHNEVVRRLHFRFEKLSPFLKDETIMGDFSEIVEQARGKDDAVSKALIEEVESFRAWLRTNDREVRELAAYSMAYAGLFDQQMASAWSKPRLLPRKHAGALRSPDLSDDSFPTMAGISGLIRAAEKDRADRRKSTSGLIDPQELAFYEVFGRGWSSYAGQEYEQAIKQYELALGKRPGDPKTLNNIANVWTKKGNFPKAESYYQKALESTEVEDRSRAIFELNFALMWSAKAEAAGLSPDEQRKARQTGVEHGEAATRLAPTDFVKWNELGNLYFNNKQWDLAEGAYRTASEMAPNDPVILENWAEACAALDKLDGALGHFEDAVERTPPGESGKEVQKARFYARIADLLEQQHNFIDAKEYRRKAMESDCANSRYLLSLQNTYLVLKQDLPGDEFARWSEPFCASSKAEDHYRVGKAQFLRSDYLGALEELGKAVRLDPDNAAYNYHLGRSLRSLSLHDMAAGSYRKALELDPHKIDYCRSLGLALHAAGHYEEALESLQRALDSNPSDIDCLIAIALCHANGKELNLEQAIAVCNRAIAAYPKDYRIYQCLGEIQKGGGAYLESMRQFAEAFSMCTDTTQQKRLLQERRQVCDQALAHDADNLDLLTISGEIYALMGRYREALDAYDKAAAAGRQDERRERTLASLRGDMNYRLAETDETSRRDQHYLDAIEQWKVALAKETVPSERAKLFNNIGTAYDGMGQRNEALKMYWQSAELAPTAKVARYNFALALYRHGEFLRALAEFETSYCLGFTNAQLPYQKGNCYYRLGRRDLAQSSWEEACCLDPEYPEPLSNLGVLKFELGNQDAAVKIWQEAIKRNAQLRPTSDFLLAIKRGESPQLAICEAHNDPRKP